MEAKPVPFIQIGDDGTLEVRAEAMESLQRIREPLHVVAVAGLYRTGKSFLLNQLLGLNAGFRTDPTVQACTKGLWLWGQPVRKNGKLILFLDTEGIASVDQHGTNDVKVFALSILLSSFFVYNSMGTIDESAIDRLSLVVELTKHIRSRSEGDQSLSDLSQFFPSFMWLVRDHVLSMEKDGREMTASEYLEWALQPGKRHETNKVRESIKQLFRDRDCFTLIRPVNDERQLRRVSELPTSGLRPEFRESMDDLKKSIFSNLRSKQLYGKAVNGPMFIELAQQYVKAMNEGAVPTVATAWENVMVSQCEKAVQAGIAEYKDFFKGKTITVDTPDAYMEVFESMHKDAEKAAWEAYRGLAMGDEQGPYEMRLRDDIKESYKYRRSEVKNHVDSLAQVSVDGIVEDIEKKLNSGQYKSANTLREDIDAALVAHCKTASVALTGDVLLRAVTTRILPIMVRLSDSLILSEKASAQKEIRDATAAAEGRIAAASESHLKELHNLQLQEKEAKLKVESSTHRIQELQQTISTLKSENDKLVAENRASTLNSSSAVSKLEAQLEVLRTQHAHELKSSEAARVVAERTADSARKENSEGSNKLHAKISKLELELEKMRNEYEKLKCDRDVQEKVKNDYKSKAENAERRVASLTSDMDLARADVERLEVEMATLKQSQEVTNLVPSGTKRGRDDFEPNDVEMEDSASPPKKAKAAPTKKVAKASEDQSTPVAASSSQNKMTAQERKKRMAEGKKKAADLVIGPIRQYVNVQRKRGCDVKVPADKMKPEKPWREAYETHYLCQWSDSCLL